CSTWNKQEADLAVNTIVLLKLDFVAQKKGGHGRLGRVDTVYLLAPCPLEPRSMPTHTGETPTPLFKNPKASGFWFKVSEVSGSPLRF
ncbi:MAG: hypothetical protein EBS96_12220, partial [Spartobacteria bacterium]|nr:hypothetical protein [Spartobacteria bacterium]